MGSWQGPWTVPDANLSHNSDLRDARWRKSMANVDLTQPHFTKFDLWVGNKLIIRLDLSPKRLNSLVSTALNRLVLWTSKSESIIFSGDFCSLRFELFASANMR